MPNSLKDLNNLRKSDWKKSVEEEDYLSGMNSVLQEFEQSKYSNAESKHPLFFVVGLPRSGTTFCTQILQKSFDLGYINNLVARFWLAPLSGIKLSKQILGNSTFSDFTSNYASTEGLNGIHEFGYFWRHWLLKESVEDFKNYSAKENQINWVGLKKTVNNIQLEMDKPMVMKNNFGGFHTNKLLEHFENAFVIYIKRDPIDVAISILDARMKFFEDSRTWWATITPNFEKLKNLSPHQQIIGQIEALKGLYESQVMSTEFTDRKIVLNYAQLSSQPNQVLKDLQEKVNRLTGSSLSLNPIKEKIIHRTYSDRTEERKLFTKLLKDFQ